jgi:hypothetical protein
MLNPRLIFSTVIVTLSGCAGSTTVELANPTTGIVEFALQKTLSPKVSIRGQYQQHTIKDTYQLNGMPLKMGTNNDWLGPQQLQFDIKIQHFDLASVFTLFNNQHIAFNLVTGVGALDRAVTVSPNPTTTSKESHATLLFQTGMDFKVSPSVFFSTVLTHRRHLQNSIGDDQMAELSINWQPIDELQFGLGYFYANLERMYGSNEPTYGSNDPNFQYPVSHCVDYCQQREGISVDTMNGVKGSVVIHF